MIIKSDQGLHYFPNNKPYHFKTKLQQTLKFLGKWKLALTEVELNEKRSSKESLYIYASICGETIINGTNVPLLRRAVADTGKNTVLKSLYYVPVIKTETNEIEFVIKTEKGALADHLKEAVTLVIHFRAYPFYM